MLTAFTLTWIELFFVILLFIIIKNIKDKKNIDLALNFCYVIFFLAVLKLFMFAYMHYKNISMCSLSKKVYC